MFEDVDRQKHFIRYKNDWIFREDLGFEPHPWSLPSLHPPVIYNTVVNSHNTCSYCSDHTCYKCVLSQRKHEIQEEYELIKNELPPIYKLDHRNYESYRVLLP